MALSLPTALLASQLASAAVLPSRIIRRQDNGTSLSVADFLDPNDGAAKVNAAGLNVETTSTQVGGFDTPQCIFGDEDGFATLWYVQVPVWEDNFDLDTMTDHFKGSMGDNSDCVAGEDSVVSVMIGNAVDGGANTTFAATLSTASICGDTDMTAIIEAATGISPGIACLQDSSENASLVLLPPGL